MISNTLYLPLTHLDYHFPYPQVQILTTSESLKERKVYFHGTVLSARQLHW